MITLFHAGYDVIKEPDVHYGRKNADFGQGFYTTDDSSFAGRWVREKSGAEVVVNKYELDESSLKIKRLERDRSWFEYIFSNRRVKPDIYADYDVIIGPIANDTIYETFGIITSGFLSDDEAMKLLMVGPCSYQIVLKSKKAADNLKFISSEVLSTDVLTAAAKLHQEDNERFQTEFARVMKDMEE
jgi:hypothetical protein